MLDVRPAEAYRAGHIVCAVSAPLEDGLDEARLLQRVVEHDEIWGWCLQHPFVVVYDEASSQRAQWLVGVLRRIVDGGNDGAERAPSPATPGARLLQRLSWQTRQVLLLRHADFFDQFGMCCSQGNGWDACAFFDELGPLPRCAAVHPRIFLAGRAVQLQEALLRRLGVTHLVVNADAWDVMDSTTGGGSRYMFSDRLADVSGMRYLKCDIPDVDEDADILPVLAGAAQFLQECAAQGGVALVKVHGLSRSASVACAFLMQSRGLSPESALDSLKAAGLGSLDERIIWWEALRGLRASAGQRKRALEDTAQPSNSVGQAAIAEATHG